MVHSMTAFSRQDLEADWGSLQLELRSVNQRYLEPHFRLPEALRDLEPGFRDALRKRLARGKIECTLRFEASESGASLSVNRERLGALSSALGEVRAVIPEVHMPDALAMLGHPGVLESSGLDIEAVKSAAQQMFQQALNDLVEGRAREGEQLKTLIEDRLSAIHDLVAEVREKMPDILERQRTQLEDKLASLQVELDPQRLEAEVVLMAQKADVAEELDRLDTHVTEVGRQLRQKGPIGRRLDFLMQELNREANTLSSKSVVADTTRCAVELKVLIEQMREQIQNIE
ncbi:MULTISPECIES: YicC/YloC family endoribonuclease [Halomonas]|uniref:YicC/YloC family endoribonuclease n=1 Tax=Halomonas TaxID=2745 RepID=UPI001C965A02|nr:MULTISPECIES: YicC/YloC family endoribonuclease [Halomonas]MBY5983428.1 YicC family protein [Halomonas sp. DP5Y7-2]MBY6206237.1 YicC family protein [Halomonas sp. DP3Y7-2]MBY6227872.1 YicC family protein [Halomonas sp. DP3Y7-1]MCA0915939.1 YicC family protein [Halomonas denitrificans]